MGQELGEPSPSTSIVRQLEVRYESALLHPPTPVSYTHLDQVGGAATGLAAGPRSAGPGGAAGDEPQLH